MSQRLKYTLAVLPLLAAVQLTLATFIAMSPVEADWRAAGRHTAQPRVLDRAGLPLTAR